MRVYEFAKEFGISNKQIIDTLSEAGVVIKSHMSVLDDKACDILEKAFLSKSDSPGESEVKNHNNILNDGEDVQLGKDKRISKPKEQKSHTKKKFERGKKKAEEKSSAFSGEREITLKSMSVADLAAQAHISTIELIVLLLKWGIVAAKNQIVGEDVVERIADHFGLPKKGTLLALDNFEKLDLVGEKNLQSRLPVVVIVGHVDHGKTTLLDFIRKTRVAAGEKGGITQHLGAYEAHTDKGNIVFIDTPGHEAFGKIRQRGVRVADIVILIVAADDGVMPQTVESIKRAKEMNVPIIVAINKVDKADAAQIEVVKRQLAQYDVLPEDWGGDVICVPISASTGKGVDELLDMISLQAEMLELRAVFSGDAQGYILESQLEKGRGATATCILQGGRLATGDYFVCGDTSGRVVTLTDSFNKNIKNVGPSLPIRITGFDAMPQVGDILKVVSKEEYRKNKDEQKKITGSVGGGSNQECLLRLLIKTDTNSSREALVDSVMKLSGKMKNSISVVSAGIGNITEGDVEFAFNTGAEIVGLHVKTEPKAIVLAQHRGIKVDLFDIIYKLLEDAEKRVNSRKVIETELVKIGQATVLHVFNIKRIGVIAGCKVDDGKFVRNGYVIGYRGNQKIGEGKILSLQREKKSVQEIGSGYECGFVVENISEWQEGDRAECYISQEKK